jgi:Flp pilus assembly protein TadG
VPSGLRLLLRSTSFPDDPLEREVAVRCHDDRGQATPLLALVLVVMVGASVALGLVGRVLAQRAQAQTAADAAALAGAVEGRGGADDLARRNHARVVSFTIDGRDTVVVVVIDRVRATARARATAGVGSP